MSSYYDTSGGQVRLIPGAGTYLQDQAKAQSAYERSKAQLMAQRSQTQIKAGLNKEYQVDPNAQYGSYQQLLQTQGSELTQANESAQQRGFFGSGLGNQGESALRYGHAVANLGFKNSLADYESGYQAQMGDLERQKNADFLGSLQGAYGDAVSDEDYTPYDPSAPSDPGDFFAPTEGAGGPFFPWKPAPAKAKPPLYQKMGPYGPYGPANQTAKQLQAAQKPAPAKKPAPKPKPKPRGIGGV